MKHLSSTSLWSIAGLIPLLSLGLHLEGVAAERIIGKYEFEGKAKAKDTADGSIQTKKFKGTIKVARKSVTFQIPVSVDGKVLKCNRMVKCRLNKALKGSPNRAGRRATFVNATCRNSKWTGSLRLKWIQHPEGYAMSFSIGGINDEMEAEKITGKFTGSKGTLSTEENQPEIPEVPPGE